ncbi:hypothetical protein M2283_006672 [Streptomyces pseudovenezuelae]|uniref:Uncharacterized protein n=1 Tax=Streptomyces pseudovenezuelae TaxID=67350 RepID=A0ABT6LSM3_9ACTN|nr:hypothetical protein [Streptomyces pseudovenezuelae]
MPRDSRLVARTRRPGARREEQRGEPGGVRHQVFAVVEHQEDSAVRQGGEQSVRAVRRGTAEALAHAERGQHGVRDPRAVGERRQLDEAGLGVPARGLDRQPRLARAAGAGERDQTRVGQEGGDPGEFGLTSDEPGELDREPEPHGLGAAPEQLQVQRGQLRRGIGPELVGERAPGLLVHRERLRGPPGRVQGPHQLPVQPLAQRPDGQQRPQLRYEFGSAAEREIRLDPVLYGGRPELFQAGGLGVRVREVGQRRTAPQGERLAQLGRRPRGITGGERGTPLLGQVFEAVGVDRVRRGGDAVAGRDRLDVRVRGQPPAQAGYLRLEGVGGSGGWLGAVQAVCEALRGDRAARVQEQERQQGAGAGAAGVDGGAVVGADVQRAQDAEAHSCDSGSSPRLSAEASGIGHSKKPVHTRWTGSVRRTSSGYALNSASARDLAGLDARGAGVHALRRPTDHGTYALDVRVPATGRTAVRVRDVVAEARALAADVAVGSHGSLQRLQMHLRLIPACRDRDH